MIAMNTSSHARVRPSHRRRRLRAALSATLALFALAGAGACDEVDDYGDDAEAYLEELEDDAIEDRDGVACPADDWLSVKDTYEEEQWKAGVDDYGYKLKECQVAAEQCTSARTQMAIDHTNDAADFAKTCATYCATSPKCMSFIGPLVVEWSGMCSVDAGPNGANLDATCDVEYRKLCHCSRYEDGGPGWVGELGG